MSARVVHVLPDLEVGGAERVAIELASRAGSAGWPSAIVTIKGMGALASFAAERGIEIHDLALGFRPSPLRVVKALRAITRELRPGVVQSWMYLPNVASIMARYPAGPPVIWTIRRTGVRQLGLTRSAVAAYAGAPLSYLAAGVAYCAESSARAHAAIGYDRRRSVVIRNGVDVETFAPAPSPPSPPAPRANATGPVVGLVGRVHRDKGHDLFVQAAALVLAKRPDMSFVLCGREADAGNAFLQRALESAGLAGDRRVRLVGERLDVVPTLRAIDIGCCASRTEGFPNALAELMAVGVPCVTTDVGDAAEIVGTAGSVVPRGDVRGLADAILRLASLDVDTRRSLGQRARDRIVERFSMEEMVDSYVRLYERVLAGRVAAGQASRR